MNKTIKYSIFILICIITFFMGFMLQGYQASRNNDYATIESIENKSLEEGLNFKSEKNIVFKLSESDISFLEKHILGQWTFSERIFTLNEDNNIYYNAVSNFSDEGVEEIKESVVILFSENSVSSVVKINQDSLSNARDMYLFSMWGGFHWASYPHYGIEDIGTSIVTLEDIYYDDGCDVQLAGVDNLIKVTYRLSSEEEMYDNNLNSYTIYGKKFANVAYVDPNDVDSIYLDFCGLWKMNRDDKYYGTNVKLEY
jgi:hypothetical protein